MAKIIIGKKLISRCAEYIPQNEAGIIEKNIPGIYVLYRKHGKTYRVMYIGMTEKCIRSRINAHAKSRRKKKLWTHFSMFEMKQISFVRQLEGIILHINRNDPHANKINKIHGSKFIREVRICKGNLSGW